MFVSNDDSGLDERELDLRAHSHGLNSPEFCSARPHGITYDQSMLNQSLSMNMKQ